MGDTARTVDDDDDVEVEEEEEPAVSTSINDALCACMYSSMEENTTLAANDHKVRVC